MLQLRHSSLLRTLRRPNYQSSQKAESGGSRPNRPPASMYHFTDLAVGKPIAVYGMNLLIRDADSAAATHYAAQGLSLELNCADEMAASLMATTNSETYAARVQREGERAAEPPTWSH